MSLNSRKLFFFDFEGKTFPGKTFFAVNMPQFFSLNGNICKMKPNETYSKESD